MKRVNIRITEEVHAWFAEKSKKTGVSMSSLMYLALEQHIQSQSMVKELPDFIGQLKKLEESGQIKFD